MRRALALIELFARTSGAAAAVLAIPLFGGVGLAAAILFAGQGMSARDLVALERSSAAARAALWTGWIVLSVAPARALLGARSAAWLRSLPVSRAAFVVLSILGLTLLQGPWLVLFGRARGGLDGLGAGLTAAALAAGLASFRALRWEALVLLGPLASVALALPLAPSLGLALPACWLAARAGFFRGADLPPSGILFVRGPAVTALAGALLARLARGERAAVMRALLAAAAGGALGALGARNQERLDGGFVWLVLPIATLPLVIGVGVLAGPLARADAALGWLLASTATAARTRVGGRFLAAALAGGLLGLVAAAAALLSMPVGAAVAVAAVVTLTVWSASLGALALFVVGRAVRGGKREGGAITVGLVALGILAVLCAAGLDAPAPFAALLATCAAAAVDVRDEARRR